MFGFLEVDAHASILGLPLGAGALWHIVYSLWQVGNVGLSRRAGAVPVEYDGLRPPLPPVISDL